MSCSTDAWWKLIKNKRHKNSWTRSGNLVSKDLVRLADKLNVRRAIFLQNLQTQKHLSYKKHIYNENSTQSCTDFNISIKIKCVSDICPPLGIKRGSRYRFLYTIIVSKFKTPVSWHPESLVLFSFHYILSVCACLFIATSEVRPCLTKLI